ncbi:MAG: hypothetical protein IPM13_07865 [Phycisphaerales bacterium]|nr:hypothetical protein [Phycisphaerales bacterium]
MDARPHPARSLWPLATLLVLLAAALYVAPRASADEGVTSPVTDAARVVKRFDFDERKRGNFERTPMRWTRVAGPGQPSYSDAALDDSFGHAAAPSFHFALRGGNIGYVYGGEDLPVSPGADYVLEGYLRAQGLTHASAFIVCYLVDALGDVVPGSHRVTPRIAGDCDWTRVDVEFSCEAREARRLGIELWVLQDYAWMDESDRAFDPITRQEVQADVWFDDIALHRQPRLRLAVQPAGGLVRAGRGATLDVAAHNPTLDVLEVEVAVVDVQGNRPLATRLPVEASASAEASVPVPPLEVGYYRVEAVLRAADDVLVERRAAFVVLPELGGGSGPGGDVGVDLGPWAVDRPDQLSDLVSALPCSLVRVALPGPSRGALEAVADGRLKRLTRELTQGGRELVAALPEDLLRDLGTGSGVPIGEAAGSVIAACGGVVTYWQRGVAGELGPTAARWEGAIDLGVLRARLSKLVAEPRLVVPLDVLSSGASRLLGAEEADAAESEDQYPHAAVYRVPAELPAHALPWQLAFLAERNEGADAGSAPGGAPAECWLSLEWPAPGDLGGDERLIDIVRRGWLAKAMGPRRLLVPAPLEPGVGASEPAWMPGPDYIPLRSLLHYLNRAQAITTLDLGPDNVAILFRRAGEHLLVLWTWREDERERHVALAAGPRAVLCALDGSRTPLPEHDGRALLPLKRLPQIVSGVDANLLRLEDSFSLESRVVQVHTREPRPLLRLANPGGLPVRGTVELDPPEGWQVEPRTIALELAPGATLEQPLTVVLPTRPLGGLWPLGITIRLSQPTEHVLTFPRQLEVGIEGVPVEVRAWREGADLVIEQSLANQTEEPVSFNAFCQHPDRPRQEAAYLGVPPGETRMRRYRVADVGESPGRVWLAIQEIDGPRRLDHLVEVPPAR